MGKKIPHSILVHDLLATELDSISETGNCIEFVFQCQINYGPEWNVELSFSYKPLAGIFLIIGLNNEDDFTKHISLSKVVFLVFL